MRVQVNDTSPDDCQTYLYTVYDLVRLLSAHRFAVVSVCLAISLLGHIFRKSAPPNTSCLPA